MTNIMWVLVVALVLVAISEAVRHMASDLFDLITILAGWGFTLAVMALPCLLVYTHWLRLHQISLGLLPEFIRAGLCLAGISAIIFFFESIHTKLRQNGSRFGVIDAAALMAIGFMGCDLYVTAVTELPEPGLRAWSCSALIVLSVVVYFWIRISIAAWINKK
jgi:hypothetical protein